MAAVSAGLLPFRRRPGLQVFLVHPGGPFWTRRDDGAWSLPKGELEPGRDALAEAIREFVEETGLEPCAPYLPLGDVRQAGGKRVQAWAFEAELDPAAVRSNTFELEWPPRSGRRQVFPEIDRAGWFDLDAARVKMNAGQVPLLDRLVAALARQGS